MLEQIKGFMGITIGSSLVPTVMHGISSIGAGMSAGMKSATQSLVGVGIVGHAASLSKGLFKW